MTLEDLIQRVRIEADDLFEPYFWSDEVITDWLNEAQEEAAIRGRLIHESDNAAVCTLKVKAGKASYPLHASLYEIDHLAFNRDGLYRVQPLKLVSGEALDSIMPDWRNEEGDPEYAIQGDKGLRLVPRPTDAGVVNLEGYRLPLSPMVTGSDEPGINAAHHRHLVHWALSKAFRVPDAEVFDPQRAQNAEALFTRYFGQQTDSDLRRMTREDVQHHVEPYWP